MPLQVDASPDRPAPGEIREKEAPTPSKAAASGGTPIDGMIIGANVNSYLRRGAEFDVMRNVEAGVEDAGATQRGAARCSLRFCSKKDTPCSAWTTCGSSY